MKHRPIQYEDNDDVVVCDMNVEGTRWYDKRIRTKRDAINKEAPIEQMTRAETWRYTWYSILAGMLVVSVFSVTWILFTLFCTKIWFR